MKATNSLHILWELEAYLARRDDMLLARHCLDIVTRNLRSVSRVQTMVYSLFARLQSLLLILASRYTGRRSKVASGLLPVGKSFLFLINVA